MLSFFFFFWGGGVGGAKKGKGIHVVEIFVLPLLIIIVMCLSKFTSMAFVVMLILSLLWTRKPTVNSNEKDKETS